MTLYSFNGELKEAGGEYICDSVRPKGEFLLEGRAVNVVCGVFVLQEGEGKMAPPSSSSQSTQASAKCLRKTSSMLLLT